MPKPEREFFPVDGVAWTVVAGKVGGLTEGLLAVDEEAGVATRLPRFVPGTDTTPNGAQSRDFWEEVYILAGSIDGVTLGQTFGAGPSACRPPGMKHGPWISPEGCVTFEVRYVAAGRTAKPH